jgi:homospermidine synthase
MVGCGSIGQAVLPLIVRHIGVPPERITVVAADERGRDIVSSLGASFLVSPLQPDNYRAVLAPLLSPDGFLLNVSVNVSSLELLEFACRRGVLYLDTAIEPWVGGYTDPSLTLVERSNHAFRRWRFAESSAPDTRRR